MFTLPLDQAKMGSFVYESHEVITDFNTHQPRTNKEGNTQYKISCRYVPEGETKAVTVEVKIYLAKEPNIPAYTPIAFAGLTALYWENGNRSGVSFSADRVGGVQQQK